MARMNFDACFAETEKFEGWHQFSDDRFDPGGATYDGVTQRAYDAWRKRQGSYLRSVRVASDDEVRAIAKEQFWDAVKGDDLFAGLDMVAFDASFNAGPVRSIKFLQQALGVPADGQFGLETLGALQKINDRAALIQRYCALRMSFWHMLTTFWRFGKGWTARGVGVEAKALSMLGATP